MGEGTRGSCTGMTSRPMPSPGMRPIRRERAAIARREVMGSRLWFFLREQNKMIHCAESVPSKRGCLVVVKRGSGGGGPAPALPLSF